VPAIGAYVVGTRRPRRLRAAWLVGALCVLLLGVGGLYALRLERGDNSARAYVDRESKKLSPVLRPILPLYINGAFPLEAERRLYDAVPSRFTYDAGAASLASLPRKLFPEGKSQYSGHVRSLMASGTVAGISWTVAGYQGRLLADLGWIGVMLGSALLGFLFGALYRWARGRARLATAALVGFLTYYAAYMVYDNQLSFSLIAIYDVAAIAAVERLALRRAV